MRVGSRELPEIGKLASGFVALVGVAGWLVALGAIHGGGAAAQRVAAAAARRDSVQDVRNAVYALRDSTEHSWEHREDSIQDARIRRVEELADTIRLTWCVVRAQALHLDVPSRCLYGDGHASARREGGGP